MIRPLSGTNRHKKRMPNPKRNWGGHSFFQFNVLFPCYLSSGLHHVFKLEVVMQEVDDGAWEDPRKESSYDGDDNHQGNASWHFQFVYHVAVCTHEHLANHTKVVDVGDDAGGNHGAC